MQSITLLQIFLLKIHANDNTIVLSDPLEKQYTKFFHTTVKKRDFKYHARS